MDPKYGSGFSYCQLNFCRQFYHTYLITNALRLQFNWTQYRLLIQIADSDKREYYELEAANNGWTACQLKRQINSQLYERLLLSNDKECVFAVARQKRILIEVDEYFADLVSYSHLCLPTQEQLKQEIDEVIRLAEETNNWQ